MDPLAPPDRPGSEDLSERVARLEAQVAWLLQRPQPSAPAPKPALLPPPTPQPRPRQPARSVAPAAWIAGAAATLFLLGAAFFLRWAVQQGWLGPGVRFALGVLAGGALTAFAARLIPGEGRRLSTSLLLAGLGTLHFTFRAGALVYHFYPAALGLAAVALLTLAAGALAARGRHGGALTASVASGLAAPLVFSQGGHHEVALATYLAVLMAAVLAVPYLARRGGAWHGARWTALLGVWLLLLPSCWNVPASGTPLLAILLILHLLLAGLLAWLPGHPEEPGTPAALWLVPSILATGYGWVLWGRLGFAPEAFAFPVVGAAVLNGALVKLVRRRLGDRRADLSLLALAAAYAALAAPIALAWRWVGPLWGLFALGTAWAALKAEEGAFAQEAPTLRWLAGGLALLATLRWLFHGAAGLFVSGPAMTPLFNPAFAEGALASLAWFLLARRRGALAAVAFLALEGTANGTVAAEAARLVQWLQGSGQAGSPSRAASIAVTLVWALSGAAQWLGGLNRRDAARRGLLAAGYGWMGVAALKLLLVDLAQADTPLRALAFLGVGGIGMAAAVAAHVKRPSASAAPAPPPRE